MSEERLARIEETQGEFHQRHQRFDQIDRRFAGIEKTQEEFRQAVDHRFDALGRQMRVLHEAVIGRIQSIADPAHSIRRDASTALSVALSLTKGELKAGDAEILETFNRRLDPLELTVRDHSAQLAKRKLPRIQSGARVASRR